MELMLLQLRLNGVLVGLILLLFYRWLMQMYPWSVWRTCFWQKSEYFYQIHHLSQGYQPSQSRMVTSLGMQRSMVFLPFYAYIFHHYARISCIKHICSLVPFCFLRSFYLALAEFKSILCYCCTRSILWSYEGFWFWIFSK